MPLGEAGWLSCWRGRHGAAAGSPTTQRLPCASASTCPGSLEPPCGCFHVRSEPWALPAPPPPVPPGRPTPSPPWPTPLAHASPLPLSPSFFRSPARTPSPSTARPSRWCPPATPPSCPGARWTLTWWVLGAGRHLGPANQHVGTGMRLSVSWEPAALTAMSPPALSCGPPLTALWPCCWPYLPPAGHRGHRCVHRRGRRGQAHRGWCQEGAEGAASAADGLTA